MGYLLKPGAVAMPSRLKVSVALLLLAIFSLAQTTPTRKTLVINHSSAPDALMEIHGRLYADLQSVAQMLNASLSFHDDSVVLQLPDGPGAASSADHLSPEFQTAAINALSQAREYKGLVEGVLEVGAPISGTWLRNAEGQAVAAVTQAQVAASTEADRNAYAFLNAGFSQLQTWANSAIADRNAMNATRSISENALQNDPTLAKLSRCGRFFNSMVASGKFSDDPSCR
jgi:hypothetical protein